MPLLACVEGRLMAIEGARETWVEGELIKISKAIFLVTFGVDLKVGVMLFWEEQADMVLDLCLGKIYRFIAGMEIEEDRYVLYFLPRLTRFDESYKRGE